MEKVIQDGRVAVLVSRGFGAGWSSWNREFPELLFDPFIVNLLLEDPNERDKIQAYMDLKYPDVYTGGLDDLVVQWVPQGAKFRIHEYDGSESLVLESEEQWVIA